MARGNKTTLILTIGGIALGAGVLYYAWSSGFLAELTGGGAPVTGEEPIPEAPAAAAPENIPGVTDFPTLTDTLNAPAPSGGYTPFPTSDDGYIDTGTTPTPTVTTPTYPTPDAQGCYPGTRYSNCYKACVPAGLHEPASNSVYCVGYVPPVVTPPAVVVPPVVTPPPVTQTCSQLYGGGCGTECGNGTKLTDTKCIACRGCFPGRPHIMCNEDQGYRWNGAKCTKTALPGPVPIPIPGRCPSGMTGTFPNCRPRIGPMPRPKPRDKDKDERDRRSAKAKCLNRCHDACRKVKSKDRGRCNQTCERSCKSIKSGGSFNIGSILRRAGINYKSNLALAYAGSSRGNDGVFDTAYYVAPVV